MSFQFPPTPPGYVIVVIARMLLGVWAAAGVTVLAIRLRNWKFIQPREMKRWIIAAIVSIVVAQYGFCRFPAYDENGWLVPATLAAISVSISGVATGLAKLYGEGYAQLIQKGGGIVCASLILTIILGVLLLLPTCSTPQYASDQTACRNNLREIGRALHNHEDERHAFPAFASGPEPVSWRVAILPRLDAADLFGRYDQRVAWNQSPNDKVAAQKVQSYSCPANYDPQNSRGQWYSAYSMLTGQGTVGANAQGTRFKDITDGSSNTFMIVEACGSQIVWSEPHDVDFASQPAGVNLKGDAPGKSAGWLSSYHPRGANVLLADGSVRFISNRVDPVVLKTMATIDGNETVPTDDSW